MGNGISEALKIKIFWGTMPPDPPWASRLRRLFTYAFLCLPKRKKTHYAPVYVTAQCKEETKKRYHVLFNNNTLLNYYVIIIINNNTFIHFYIILVTEKPSLGSCNKVCMYVCMYVIVLCSMRKLII